MSIGASSEAQRRLRVVYFGSPSIALPTLHMLAERHDVLTVVTQPDRPAGRGRALSAPPVKIDALARRLEVLQPESLKDPLLAERLAALRADLFVVMAYGRILPPALLDAPRLGAWNLHASLLPKYRGAAPIQWAIMRGERRTGVCLMRMEPGLDTGPVGGRVEVAIADDETAGSLEAKLAPLAADLLRRSLPAIATRTLILEPQDHAAATVAPPLRKADGHLDFRRTAAEVSAWARGVDPWPGAFATAGDEIVRLFRPRIEAASGAPGSVLAADASGLLVACGMASVRFGELQLPGRRRLPAAAVLAGWAARPGLVLT